MKYVTHYKNNTYTFDDLGTSMLSLVMCYSREKDEYINFDFVPELFGRIHNALRVNSHNDFQRAIKLLLLKFHPDKINNMHDLRKLYLKAACNDIIINDYVSKKLLSLKGSGAIEHADIDIIAKIMAESITQTLNLLNSSCNFTNTCVTYNGFELNAFGAYLNEFLHNQSSETLNQPGYNIVKSSIEYTPQELVNIETHRIEKERIEKDRLNTERLRKKADDRAKIYYELCRNILTMAGIVGVGALAVYSSSYFLSILTARMNIVDDISVIADISGIKTPVSITNNLTRVTPVFPHCNIFEYLSEAPQNIAIHRLIEHFPDLRSIAASCSLFEYLTKVELDVKNRSLDQHDSDVKPSFPNITTFETPVGASLMSECYKYFQNAYNASSYAYEQSSNTYAFARDNACNTYRSTSDFFKRNGLYFQVGGAVVTSGIAFAIMSDDWKRAALIAPQIVIPVYCAGFATICLFESLHYLYNKMTVERELPKDEIKDQKAMESENSLPLSTSASISIEQNLESESRIMAARKEAESVLAMEDAIKCNIENIHSYTNLEQSSNNISKSSYTLR